MNNQFIKFIYLIMCKNLIKYGNLIKKYKIKKYY